MPSEYSSDEKRTQGHITKAGPSNARRLLVEAAHNYRHRPAVGENLKARQSGQDPRVVEIAWRCQQRLHGRWMHLAARRGKSAGTVAVAVARDSPRSAGRPRPWTEVGEKHKRRSAAAGAPRAIRRPPRRHLRARE